MAQCVVCSTATDEQLPVLEVPLCPRERRACAAKYWRALPAFYRTLVIDHHDGDNSSIEKTPNYHLSKIGHATGCAMSMSRLDVRSGEVVHNEHAPALIGFKSLDVTGRSARNKSENTEVTIDPVVVVYEDKANANEDTGVFYAMFESLPGEGNRKRPRAARLLERQFTKRLREAVLGARVLLANPDVASGTLEDFFKEEDATMRELSGDADGSAATLFLSYFGDLYAGKEAAVFAWVGSSVGALLRNDNGRIVSITTPHTRNDDREDARIKRADVDKDVVRKQFLRNTRALGLIDRQLRQGIIAEPTIEFINASQIGRLDNEEEGGKRREIKNAVTLLIMSRDLAQEVDNNKDLREALDDTADATPDEIADRLFKKLRGLFRLGFSREDNSYHLVVVKFFDLPGLFNIQFEDSDRPAELVKLNPREKQIIDSGRLRSVVSPPATASELK